jgi:hypothetical protein
MSLINDALKRASQADRNRPLPAATRAAMEPAAGGGGWSWTWALAGGVVVALALAGWFFRQWWDAGRQAVPVKVEAVAALAPGPAPVAREAVAPPSPAIAPAPVTAIAAAPTIPPRAPALDPAPAPPASAVEAPWPAELKLMGIFFSKTNPRALISGKTVAPGDDIAGIRVTKIENDRVTLEWNGRVKEMILEGN